MKANEITSRVLFHISWKRNRANILKKGLLPLVKEFPELERKPAIYLFETQPQAEDWAYYFGQTYGEKPIDIWKVNIPSGIELQEDTTDMSDVYDSWFTFTPIPPENIKVVYTMTYFGNDFTPPDAPKVKRNI